jgi:hypothetical protein
VIALLLSVLFSISSADASVPDRLYTASRCAPDGAPLLLAGFESPLWRP